MANRFQPGLFLFFLLSFQYSVFSGALYDGYRKAPEAVYGKAVVPFTGAHSPNVCDRPELLQADQITDVSARLIWADVGDEYEVELIEAGQNFTGIPNYSVPNDPPFEVNGLTPGRNYRFQVRTVCEDGEYSEWSTARSFSTELNNAVPCGLSFDLRDTSCSSGGQFFNVHVDDAPGMALGTDVLVRGIRLMVEHPWRSDLRVWLNTPDGARVKLIDGLNAGDKNIGDPSGTPCVQFVELIQDSTVAQPLSAAAERDNFTGYYLPVESLTGLHSGQNPNGVWQLEICDAKANDKGKLRLFQIVFARADCAVVDSVSAENVTENSADIAWPDDFAGDSIVVEYGPAGFIPGNESEAGEGGAVLALAQPVSFVALNGLMTLQHYQVYVRRQCAPGLWSANSYAAGFFTNCAPTLLENPDTLGLCPSGCPDPCPLPGVWRNVPGDDYEWKVRTGPGITYPIAGPPSAPEGTGNYFFFRNSCTFSGANGKKAFLRTRCIQVDAPPGRPCHFSFDHYQNTKSGQMSTLMLQASTNGGQSWTTVQSWAGNQGKQWRRRYVDLSAFDGQVTVFQFVATGVFAAYGDIALDNLAFYGSTLAGTPDYVFYRDADGDGFGNGDQSVIGCSPQAPPGYVAVDSDCNDNNMAVYPGAPEILCNQVDENCNGASDDAFIATPAAAGAAVCSGGSLTLAAQGTATGQFYWFDSPAGGNLLATGPTLAFSPLQATRTVWLLDSVAGPGGSCASARIPVTATAHPTPDLHLDAAPVLCQGQNLTLTALPLVDSANAQGGVTWHTALPPGFSNYLQNTLVTPSQTRTYYVFSETAFGCSDIDSVLVTVNPRPIPQILQGDSLTSCRNRTLTLTATAAGTGAPPLQYAWSNGLNFASIPVQSGNLGNVTKTYTVVVTDANGCSGVDQVKVHTLPNITQTALEAVEDVTSCGGSDGSITLRPVDGVPPYQFAWSGPSPGSMSGITGITTISGLPQGGYRVTVTDASNGGCSMVMPQIVINAPGLQVEVDTIIHPTCPGVNNGSIVLDVVGINPVFLWSNNQQTSTATGLGPGSVTVQIFDGACSQELVGLEITAPPPIEIELNALQNVSCFGGTDGAVDLAVFGATPPYEFLWTNEAETEDLVGVSTGTFQATVTDANGCLFESPFFTVSQPTALNVQPTLIQHVACFGGNTGVLAVLGSGGTPPYDYLWNTMSTSPALAALAAGNYSLTLTDDNGCSVVWTRTLTQPPPLVFSNVLTEHPECVGATDGRLEVQPAGGQMPYDFHWNTGLAGDTTAILLDRGVGQYGVTVVDANGCVLSQNNLLLSAPQLLTLTLDSLSDVACTGDQSGYIGVSVSGAQGVISATWNNQPDDLTWTNAAAGTYILRVNDSRGCAIQDTFALSEPEEALVNQLISANNALCYGEPNGSITVRTLGGTLPYEFAWSDASSDQNLPAVPAGLYTLTTTDAQGCTSVLGPIAIEEPPALVAVPTVQDIPCFGSPTGSIQLAVTGGIPPYEYLWNNNLSTQNIFDLTPANYAVTVIDATGCAQILSDLIVDDLGESFVVEEVLVQPISCSGAKDGRISVRALNGMPPYQFAWSPPVGLHANVNSSVDSATALAGGYYSVTVTDAAGCTGQSEVFYIEEAPPLSLFIGNVTHVLCKGDSTGAIPASISGGLPPYGFLWSDGATTLSADSLSAGDYLLTVTDYRGCTVLSTIVTVSEPALALDIVLDQLIDDVCGNDEGAIDIHVVGGTPPNAYAWSNNRVTPDINNLAAGEYQLVVTDQHGCTHVSPWYEIVALSDPIGLSSIVVNPVQCFGDSTGAIVVTASGGTPEYQFFWSNGESGASLTQLPAGPYQLTVTDANNCTNDFAVPVPQPPALTASVSTMAGPGGWTVTLSVSGGQGDYEIEWDANTGNQTGPVASGLSAGYYDVTISDDFGCILLLDNLAVGVNSTGAPDASWQIRLWPNPTSGLATLDLLQTLPAAWTLHLFSPLGQPAQPAVSLEKSTGHNIPLDLSALPPGLYGLKLVRDDGVVVSLQLVKIGT